MMEERKGVGVRATSGLIGYSANSKLDSRETEADCAEPRPSPSDLLRRDAIRRCSATCVTTSNDIDTGITVCAYGEHHHHVLRLLDALCV